jgi:hypothetical protein
MIVYFFMAKILREREYSTILPYHIDNDISSTWSSGYETLFFCSVLVVGKPLVFYTFFDRLSSEFGSLLRFSSALRICGTSVFPGFEQQKLRTSGNGPRHC